MEEDEWEWGSWQNEYFIRSTMLGGEVVSDVNPDGTKNRTYVRAAGAELAWQNGPASVGTVVFQHHDAAGSSYRTTAGDGSQHTDPYTEGAPAELDPMGTNAGTENPYIQQLPPGEYCVGCEPINTEMPHYENGQQVSLNLDGSTVPYSMGSAYWASGMAVQCPNNDCGPRVRKIPGKYRGQTCDPAIFARLR